MFGTKAKQKLLMVHISKQNLIVFILMNIQKLYPWQIWQLGGWNDSSLVSIERLELKKYFGQKDIFYKEVKCQSSNHKL